MDDLPNLFTVNVAQAGQRVCVLVLTNQSVLAGLLAVHASGSQLRSISERVPYTDDDSLLLAADEVLQELGKESEDVSEVVFCLEKSWFDEKNELLSDKQALLKRIKDELSLQPVGYVLQHETITEHLLSQQRQLSGLVLFLSEESVIVTLVMHGVIAVPVVVGRSGEIQSDVVEALTRVAKASGRTELPGRLLCATVTLELAELFELQQELLTVIWPESVQFLQLPVVEVIKPQLSAHIVVIGAGQALQQLESGVLDSPAAAGAAATTKEYAIEPPIATASSFGIPINPVPDVSFAQTAVEVAETSAPPSETPPAKSVVSGWLAGLKQSRHKPTRRQLLLTSSIAGLVGLLVVGLISFVFLSSTAALEIRIQPKTQQLSQEVELILDPALTEPDVQNRKVRAEKLEIELNETGNTKATGIKIVGEKAKGGVTICNKTTAIKKFAAGTIFKSEKLEYTLDEQQEVPAATVSAKSFTVNEIECGQRSGMVTATIIGVDNNIAEGLALTVADFDSGTYAAKTETALSGGSSREVQVVSQTDLDVLAADVKKNLLLQAKEQLEAKQGQDQRVIPLEKLEVVKQTFSAQEGTEVDSVSLDLTVKAVGLAYYIADLVPIAGAVLSGLVPSGYSLEGHAPQILSAGVASGSSQVRVVVNLSSKAHALVETEQLKLQLVSQSLEQAATILKSNPAVEKASFIVTPSPARSMLTTVPADLNRFIVVVIIPE